jgi:glycosyltransferase involved in cell wall biosynthesis
MVVNSMLLLLLIVAFTFLILRLSVAAYNFYSAPMLIKGHCKQEALISILIPARDEEKNIENLLKSVLLQKGVPFEVIVLDDHSSDNTKAIASAYASKYSQIKVISGKELPKGWTGKNYACHQLAQAANGRYLVFLDADVSIHPELISSALRQMENKELSLLSLFCRQQTRTFGEKVTVPLMNYLLLTLLPIKLIEGHTDPIFSAACGQFMMFRADNYRLYLWHKRARGRITEDLAIMKMLKKAGEKGEGLLSGSLMTCRMYTGFNDAVKGFSKNFITPFNDSILLFVLFLSAIMLGPLFILGTENIYLIAAVLLIVGLTRFFTGRLSGENTWQILLHPIQMFSFFYIGLIAIYRRYTRSVSWKGRTLSMRSATKEDTSGQKSQKIISENALG